VMNPRPGQRLWGASSSRSGASSSAAASAVRLVSRSAARFRPPLPPQ